MGDATNNRFGVMVAITNDGGDVFVGAKFGDYAIFFMWDFDNNILGVDVSSLVDEELSTR